MRLILGDALEVLRTLEDGSVDAVVTDPPFGIGFGYGGEKERTSDPAAYWSWLSPIHDEMLRVLKPGGLLAVWQTQLYFPHLWRWFGDDVHIYAACKNFVQLRPTPINYGYDPVVMRYKPGAPPLRPRRPPRNVDFHVAKNNSALSDPRRVERGHPCPRPLDQVSEIVGNFAAEGGVVLDPFMGSGTTAVACHWLRRDFVGVEVREDYYDLARRRLADQGERHPLFRQQELTAT